MPFFSLRYSLRVIHAFVIEDARATATRSAGDGSSVVADAATAEPATRQPVIVAISSYLMSIIVLFNLTFASEDALMGELGNRSEMNSCRVDHRRRGFVLRGGCQDLIGGGKGKTPDLGRARFAAVLAPPPRR